MTGSIQPATPTLQVPLMIENPATQTIGRSDNLHLQVHHYIVFVAFNFSLDYMSTGSVCAIIDSAKQFTTLHLLRLIAASMLLFQLVLHSINV